MTQDARTQPTRLPLCRRLATRRTLAWVVGALLSTAGSAVAAGFEARLQALGTAVEQHLASAPQPLLAPPEWRKLLWLRLPGDRTPDALVVLRSRRDECAAVATTQPCRALVLASTPEGGYRVVTEFTLRVHAVALRLEGGTVRELFHARDTGAQPAYARYRFDGEAFARVDGDIGAEQLAALPVLVADDRSMPLWADQAYAARQFPNDAAWLAPFRLHFDGATVSETRSRGYNPAGRWYDAEFEARAQRLAEALLPDAQVLARALPWPHTLELRLWSCVDWMVERRFWEVEDRRLGRAGVCVEPAAFALSRGLVQAGAPQLDLLRVALLQQVGVAYLLRVAPLSLAERTRLRQSADAAEARFGGAVAGLLIGQQRQLLTLDRAGDALDVLTKFGDLWFREIERDRMRFVVPTPELRDHGAGLALQSQALQCVRRVLGQPPHKAFAKVACEARQLETTRRIAARLQEDSRP